MAQKRRKLVMITDASSDVGAATAQHLRVLGFSILAGVRRVKDAEHARNNGMTPIYFNVTDPDQMRSARAELGERPLAGLVNTASIIGFGPLEFARIEDLRLLFEANVIGPLAATQLFVDALHAGRGRVVIVGCALSGCALPLTDMYKATEVALNEMTAVLRCQQALEGVDVIMVEAHAATTSFLREIAVRAQELLAGGPPELLQRHGPVLRGYTRRTHEHTATDTNMMARVIGEALTAPRPRARYVVGSTDGDGPRR